jgi:hypothetical protein
MMTQKLTKVGYRTQWMRSVSTFAIAIVSLVGLGGVGHAAIVTSGLTYADAPVATPGGTAFASGTGSLKLGTFYNQAGSSFYTVDQLQSIWTTKSREEFDTLSASFIALASQTFNSFSGSTAGHFRFSSTNPLETSVDIGAEDPVDLGGAQMFIFIADSLANPTSFGIMAVNQTLVGDFLDPAIPSGEGLDNSFVGRIESRNISSSVYDTTLIAGQIVSGQLRLEAVPAGSVSLALNGSSDITHFWENGNYTDAGVVASGSVVIAITDSNNAAVADFTALARTLGVYTVRYTSGGSSVSRTVRVKMQSPTADLDNDGLSNLMEYCLGGSLGSNDSSKLPVATIVGSEFILTFTARTDVTTLSQIALGFVTTTSLSAPFSGEALTQKTGVSQAGVAAGFTKQQWSFSTSGIGKKFTRITITLPSSLSGA